MTRDFKGVWIPRDIWLSKDLTLQEKIMLVEIDSLDNENGCFASNAYFSDFFELSKNRCSEIIKGLKAKGLINIDYLREDGKANIEKRVIKVVGISKGGIRNIEGGYSEKCEDNNTLFNNTDNKSQNRKTKVFPPDSDEYKLAILLYEMMKNNNPNVKEPDYQKWSKTFDSILRIDKRNQGEVIRIIKFSQTDPFWHQNILSPDKFRKQYDKLYLKWKSVEKQEIKATPVSYIYD
ncbi:MAG: helix-turn-helix protein [Anaerocolumna sp.]|jgi:hypothetical protein|nr:helix-turn-helix protein [Anaerocolumna sp.]